MGATGSLRRACLAVIVSVIGLYAAPASAQAVVDEAGSLSAALSHDFGFADTIVEDEGISFPNQYVNIHITTLALEYVPVSRLAISASLPLVGVKYDREKSGADYDPHGPYDDGSYHFTLQDFRSDVRYQVIGDPVALAFNVGVTIPVTDYPVQGSAAPGRNLKQGRLGVAFAASLPGLPRSFVNLAYTLTLSERFDATPDTEEFSQTRSDALVQAGYLVTDKLALYLQSAYRRQHDGVEFLDYDMLTASQQEFHDPILKETGLLLGLGAAFQLTERLYAVASYSHFVTGTNTLTTNVATVSLGWDVL